MSPGRPSTAAHTGFFAQKELRQYLVVGCTKKCAHPQVHPDDKWASLDAMEEDPALKLSGPDYVFDIEFSRDPHQINKPPNGYTALFFELLPVFLFPGDRSKKMDQFINALLAPDGVIIINNLIPTEAVDLARACDLRGDILFSSDGTTVIAKSEKTNMKAIADNKDLYRAINREDIPFNKHSKDITPLPDRQPFKTFIHLYDICEEYKTSRKERRLRNYFKDGAYERCLGKISSDIKSILTDSKIKPLEKLNELKAFAQKHLDDKTFPNTWFGQAVRDTRNSSNKELKEAKVYGYTMNDLLIYVTAYCDHTLPHDLTPDNKLQR